MATPKKTFLKKYSALLFLLFSIFFIAFNFSGCAAARKINSVTILQNTKFEFKELQLDSVNINPNLFANASEAIKTSLLPNPQVINIVQNLAQGIINTELGKANLSVTLLATSKDTDSLWVRKMNAVLSLDSIIDLPLTLKDSCVLAPGKNDIAFSTQFPLDKRLFQLENVRKYRIKGALNVALDAQGPTVLLEFDIEHEIKPEEIKDLKARAQESLLNGLVSDWVGAFLPKN